MAERSRYAVIPQWPLGKEQIEYGVEVRLLDLLERDRARGIAQRQRAAAGPVHAHRLMEDREALRFEARGGFGTAHQRRGDLAGDQRVPLDRIGPAEVVAAEAAADPAILELDAIIAAKRGRPAVDGRDPPARILEGSGIGGDAGAGRAGEGDERGFKARRSH